MPTRTAIARFFLSGTLAFLLPACQTVPWKKNVAANENAAADAAAADASPATPAMKLPVGTIHHIDTAGQFVLIRSSRFLQIEPGTILSAVDDQGTPAARVAVSPARKGQFLTADIVSGLPVAGQQTIMDYAPPAPGAPAAGAGMESPGADDIQVLE